MHEFRVVVRALRKSYGFASAVVLTVALAIGANTVIFSAVEAVLLHPFPARHLDRLVDIGAYDPTNGAHYALNPVNVFDLERRHDLFDAVAGYRSIDVNLTGNGEPRRIAAVATTDEFFRVFEVQPYLGRVYDERDTRSGATTVAVLSFDAWHDLTGGDHAAIGRTLRINDSSFTLIGVLPRGFVYPTGAQLWTPHPLDPLLNRHATAERQNAGWIVPTVALRRTDVTIPHLRTALEAAQRRWMASGDAVRYNRTNARLAVIARPLTLAWAGPLRQILFVLVGAVALVLLIACANIASLQLLRTTARAREIAVRLALGATRWDIIRLFATESLLLALTGGALGVALGQWLITTAGHGAAEMVPELAQLRLDPLVLAFSIATTLVTALVFGTAPAIHALRTNSRDVLNATTRNASAGRARSRVLHGAVVIQLAISLVLLLACTVTVRSFVKLLHVDPGFDATGVLTARLVLPQSRYRVATIDDARRVLAIHQQLANRLRAVSGFEAVGITDTPPFGFRSTADASMHRVATWRGSSASATTSSVAADTWSIDGDYFRALRIPLIEGPGLTGLEHAEWLRAYPNGGDLPVIIDDALRRRLFPNESPIGKVVDSMFRVVGVVGAVKKSELTPQTDEAGAIYFPTGGTLATMTFVVRSSLPFTQAAARLRDAVHAFDPTLPLFDVAPLSDLVKRSTGSREIAVSLIGALAALSLVLALLGIYSVLSYATSQRTKEIGIRVALGADPIEVARLVMRGCATLTIAGLLAGLAGYVAVGRGLASLIYGVRLDDPRTLLLAITSLAIAALLAGLPTAIRAARVDPVDALRAE